MGLKGIVNSYTAKRTSSKKAPLLPLERNPLTLSRSGNRLRVLVLGFFDGSEIIVVKLDLFLSWYVNRILRELDAVDGRVKV